MDAAMKRNLLAQLLAVVQQAVTLQQQSLTLATQADALLHLLESDTEVVTNAPGVCQHPVEKRRDLSTFGHPRFKCGTCGEIVEPKPPGPSETKEVA